MRPLVLHITSDYPDPTRNRTTPAIKRLIDSCPNTEHIVCSLLRVTLPWQERLKDLGVIEGQRVISYHYFRFPGGWDLPLSMSRVGSRISKFIRKLGLSPSVVHGHKLCYEGVAAYRVASCLKARLLVSVRGEADRKIMQLYPWSKWFALKVLARASYIYLVSAWMKKHLPDDDILSKKVRLLPNKINNVTNEIHVEPAQKSVLCIADLDVARKKGVFRLLAACSIAKSAGRSFRVDLIGWGNPSVKRRIIKFCVRLGIAAEVNIVGEMSHGDTLKAIPAYAVMALPSRNETFGMAIIEAIFAGVPVLYSKGTGVDGYLNGLDVGVGVASKRPSDIERGLQHLLENNSRYKNNIALSSAELFERFDYTGLAQRYEHDVWAASSGSAAVNSVYGGSI